MNTSWPRPTLLDLVDAVAIPAGLAVATFLAATPWLHVFSVPGTVGLLVIAAIGSVSIPSLAVRVWRQPPTVSYAASALGLLVLLVAAAGFHPHDLWHGLTTAPNRVLTETLPLGGGRALLAAPLVLTWLCGTASTELVTRSKRSNSGLAAIGLAIPVACFVVAYAVSASRPGQDEVAAPLLLVTLVAIALLRHLVGVSAAPQAAVGSRVEAEAGPSPWRAGLVGGAAAVVIAVVLAIAVPSASRMSGRPASLNRTAPLTTAVVTDPVGAMADLRDGTPRGVTRTVLRVHTAQQSNGYLAAVILDEYDGGSWSFDATFRPTGGRVPSPSAGAAASASAAGVDSVRQDTSLLAPLPVPFLPALNRAVEVTGLEVGVDAATGMLLPSNSISEPASYSVLSRTPLPTLATVSPADGIGAVPGQVLPAAGFVSESDLELPPGAAAAMATPLRFLAAISGHRPAPTVAFLQAAMASLHAYERRVDPTLPPAVAPTSPRGTGTSSRPVPATVRPAVRGTRSSGTSLSVVINAVTNDRAATPEQFATLFAMVARYLGVPARLVTGFRLTPGSNGGPLSAGSYQVTSKQAWTWVEIPVAGLGWVVADPTPNAVVGVGSPPPETGIATPTTVPNRANAVPRSEIAGGHAVAKPVPVKVPKSQSLPWWAVLLAVLGGVVVVAALVGPGLAGVRRILRRRARRRTDPAQLAVGAWLELLDGLQQAGMITGSGDTSGEVATEAGRHFGPEVTAPVQAVGAVADQAVFSVTDPPDREAAEDAWETQQRVRRAVHRGLDRRQRVRALLAVGSAPREPSNGSGSTPARFGP
jgi:hypothetical protein